MKNLFEIVESNCEAPVLVNFTIAGETPTFMDWTLEEINNFVKIVLIKAKEIFNFNYKEFEVRYNKRLKRTYAQCYYKENIIEFSYFLLEDYSDDFIKSVIIHEMVHALSYQFDGEKSKIDHSHDKVFKSMCKILCDEFDLPDSSKAFQDGELKEDVKNKIKFEKIKVEVFNKTIEITVEKTIFFNFVKITFNSYFVSSGIQLLKESRKTFYDSS